MIQYEARKWGTKAARDGLCLADNPYSNSEAREAWASGFSDEVSDQASSVLRARRENACAYSSSSRHPSRSQRQERTSRHSLLELS